MILKSTLTAETSPALDNGEVVSPEPQAAPPTTRRLVLTAELVGLVLAVGLAGGLRLWNLQQNGWGTAYYSAAVRSGMESWHNFFFNSLDPGGFVCVDKPPVAIWVQVISAKIFGFSQLSVLVPQAVMGTLSVLILWHLVRRRFGPLAGFLAALALAVMPISVAIERSNNTDACLAFVLLLAGWALIRAAEKGSLWMLLLSMFLVGVAFNTKMLLAFVVLPTFYLVYLLGAPVSWRSRLGDLALATFLVFGVALSWAVIYDLTPEDSRPYADSTQNNSMLTLIVEHNGIERFVRRGRGRPTPGATPATGPAQRLPADGPNAADPTEPATGQTPPRRTRGGLNAPGQAPGNPQRPGQGNRAGAAFAGGAPLAPGGGPGGFGGRGGSGWGGGSAVGLWRLAHPHMAGQVLWFFPLAVVGLFAAAFQARWSWTLGPAHQAILLWFGWLVTYIAVYSFAGGIFHDYYMVTMSAPMAALTGIGGTALWRSFQRGGWRSLLLPLSILLTAGWQTLVWLNYPDLAKWTVPALLIAALAAGLGLLALRGSWWGLVFTLGLLACVDWLWARDSTAPDVLAVAAAELETARTALRQVEGWDSFKGLYTKFSPDIGTLLPDLRRQAPLVSPPLLWGCAIAGGAVIVLFLLAKWRPIVARGAVLGMVVGFLALFVGPGVWALSPLWRSGGMLPAADASVITRSIREREQRAQEAGRGAGLVLTASTWAVSPGPVGAPAALFTRDLAVVMRPQRGGFGFAGGFGRPPMPGRDLERVRQDRQSIVEFLKANHHGERWLMAVSGAMQASSYIIEDGISVMPMGGFSGGNPTFGTEPEEIKARLTKLVEEGQIRFFQVSTGRGGFGGGFGGPPGGLPGGAGAAPGGNRRQAPAGVRGPTGTQPGGGIGAGRPGGFGRSSATVSQWVLEQVEKGKAKKVDRQRYTTPTPPETNPGARRPTRGFGTMGGDLYDLRPELGLQESAAEGQSED